MTKFGRQRRKETEAHCSRVLAIQKHATEMWVGASHSCRRSPHSSCGRRSLLMRILNVLALVSASQSDLGGDCGCPYDFSIAQDFTKLCNAEIASDDSSRIAICCVEIYGAAIFAASQHANSTGDMFLREKEAAECVSVYKRSLINTERVPASFFDRYCPFVASRMTANVSACSFGRVSELRRLLDLSNVSEACTGLQTGQRACPACQSQLLKSTSQLVNYTRDQFGVCGVAIAVALTSIDPSLTYFGNFYQCVLQILDGEPVATFLNIPTFPASSSAAGDVSKSNSMHVSSRTLFTLVGTFATLATIAFFVIGGMYLLRSKNSDRKIPDALSLSGGPLSSESSEATVLPTEGFYVFHLKELIKATSGFSKSLVLGQGSAGIVYAGRLPSGKVVAVKRILKEKKVETFYKEVVLLARVRHPNLTALLGYCESKFVHLLVYEFMANGDLGQILLDKTGPALTWDQRIKVAIDCAKGLTYLHEYPEGPVIHRDIKPTNILLNEHMEAQLSDFGLSKTLDLEASHVSTEIKGTTGYLDPEYLILGQITESSDVYSFGVVLLQLLSGRKAIDTDSQLNRSIVQLATLVMNEKAGFEELLDPRMEGVYSLPAMQKMAQVAYSCVQPRSYDRPSISEVLDGLELALRLGKSYSPIAS